MIYLFFIIVFQIIVQSFVRFNNSRSGIDLYRWLKYSKEIRKNKFKYPKYISGYIVKEKLSYPPIFLYLLALIEPGILKKYNFLVSPVFSILENMALFLFVQYLSASTDIALLASLIYATTPANIIENIYLGTRSIGQLTVFFYFISIYFYFSIEFSLLLVCLSIIVILLTHRMSSQLILFMHLFLSLYYSDPLFLFTFLIAILIAIVISGGVYKNVLLGHLKQIKFYVSELSNSNISSPKFFKEFVFSILSRNLYLPLIAYIYFNVHLSNFSQLIACLLVLMFFIAVITTFIKPLRSLGEGSRYIGFTNPLAAIFIALNLEENLYFLIPIFIGISFIPIAYKFYQNLNQLNLENTSYMDKGLQDELDKIFVKGKKLNFMSYPPNLDDYVCYKYPDARVMFHDNGFALKKCCIPHFVVKKENRVLEMIKQNSIDIFVSIEEYKLDEYEHKKIGKINLYTKE